MTLLDWSIVAAYLAYVVWDGARRVRGSGRLEGYFLADRSLPWWAVGLSVMATQASAITLVGTTGQAYAHGMGFIQFYYGLPLAMILLCVTLVPFFYRARVFTAYEYLERRFDARTRSLTSFFFLMSRGLGVGVIIAAPSVILSIVLGWSATATIFVIGLSTTFYTMLGGVQAVTWTDVKQMLLIFVGMGVALAILIGRLPEDLALTDALRIAGASGHLTTVDTSFDLTAPYTLWSGLIGGLFLFLAYFGTDQSQVQRYLTSRSVGQARTSLLMSAFLKIPMQFFILLIGVLVFVFYHFQPPPLIFDPAHDARTAAGAQAAEYAGLKAEHAAAHAARRAAAAEYARTHGESQAALAAYLEAGREVAAVRERAVDTVKATTGSRTFTDVNYVFPTFILTHMPAGVIGILIAAIFAAAMSSISSELNALATATVIDFYRRHFRPHAGDRHYVFAGRLATGFWGLFACVVATYATTLGSLIEVVNRFGSFFYGSLLGVFVLAVAVPRARARGAFFGLLAGIASVWLFSITTQVAFLWFNVIGCLSVVVVGYLVSLTVPEETRPAQT
jgi:SSS family transporter